MPQMILENDTPADLILTPDKKELSIIEEEFEGYDSDVSQLDRNANSQELLINALKPDEPVPDPNCPSQFFKSSKEATDAYAQLIIRDELANDAKHKNKVRKTKSKNAESNQKKNLSRTGRHMKRRSQQKSMNQLTGTTNQELSIFSNSNTQPRQRVQSILGYDTDTSSSSGILQTHPLFSEMTELCYSNTDEPMEWHEKARSGTLIKLYESEGGFPINKQNLQSLWAALNSKMVGVSSSPMKSWVTTILILN